LTKYDLIPWHSFWYTYIVRCADGTLYTGVTTDLERRVHEHNHTARGARYTRARRPVTLVFYNRHPNRSDACKHEAGLKKMDRKGKEMVIQCWQERQSDHGDPTR
jgi:putative endonuclease